MDVMLIGLGGQRAVGTEQSDSRSTLSYDLTAERLTSEQRAAEVLIPPYRGSPRPLGLLARLTGVQMVQLRSAGANEWQVLAAALNVL
jgi:hypothetical protein